MVSAETVMVEAPAAPLPDADFDVRAEIIHRLPATGHPRLLPVLEALVEGQLK